MKCMQCQSEWRLGAGECPECSAAPSGAPIAAEEGVRLFAAKHYEEALGAFERAAQLEAGDRDLMQAIAHCHFHLSQYSRAEETYLELDNADSIENGFNLGQIAIHTNRLKRARDFFALLRETAPPIAPGRYYLGLIFDSVDAFQAECHYYLALICWNTHEPEAAGYYFRQTLMLAPRHMRACRYLGNLHFQQKQYEEAANYFRRCLELFEQQEYPEKTRVEVYHQLGMTCEALGRTGEATDLFKRILDIHPGHPGAVFSLNRIYERLGLYEREMNPAASTVAEEEGASTLFGLATDEEMQAADHETSLALGERMVIGRSEAMQKVLRMARLASASDSTVLLMGENGTGKELIARVIVEHSSRSDRPFLALNCAAVAPTLIESELFGHVKGAFTGAGRRKEGYFEAANNGTILLDEIGELDLNMQVKLLRVLQEREILPVGGEHPIRINVRIIAATNRDLPAMVRQGMFREDLFYRLNVLPIRLPPLRSRPEDIPILAAHFIRKITKGHVRPEMLLSEEDIKGLGEYEWPGNVRELENIVERGIVLGARYHLLLQEQVRQQRIRQRETDEQPEDAEPAVAAGDAEPETPPAAAAISPAEAFQPELDFESFASSPGGTWRPLSLSELERGHIERMLEYTGGNRGQTARLLGINPATLWRKIKAYEIAVEKQENGR